MKPGDKYRPSNGTEGMSFIEDHCENCIHEKFMHTNNDADLKCEILSNSFLYDIDEPEYPSEWTYDAKGHPTCTKWKKWDWGKDDDPDGFNEPPPKPRPGDPVTLDMFPLYPDGTHFIKEEIKELERAGMVKT